MPKLKVEDLEKIKEKVKQATVLREGGEAKAKVTVHMGTCGIASGSREVMNAVLEKIEKDKISDVLVKASGCAGLCSKEPMITVELVGQSPVKYIEVNPEKLLKIFEAHVLGGKVVSEYVLMQGSEITDKAHN